MFSWNANDTYALEFQFHSIIFIDVLGSRNRSYWVKSIAAGVFDNWQLHKMQIRIGCNNLWPFVSSIFYCHIGSVLMNAIATQDCTHNLTFRHSSPSVFIRGDLMLKTRDLINLSTWRHLLTRCKYSCGKKLPSSLLRAQMWDLSVETLGRGCNLVWRLHSSKLNQCGSKIW